MRITILVHNQCCHLARIRRAISLINGLQRYFKLSLEINNAVPNSDLRVNAYNCSEYFTSIYPDQSLIIITESLLIDNWFSHEFRDSSVITIGDWEEHFAPPSLSSYIVFQIAQALIHFAADISEEMAMRLVHEPVQGCLLDMCNNKPDIKLSMIAGNLCPECIGKLKTFGVNEQAIDGIIRVLEIVRLEAIGRTPAFDPEAVFVIMRFTQNDENDNAWRYGIKLGVEACGFRVNRADMVVESGQILAKIYKHILRGRLIIAKVDEKNLNVYFELGLAMGFEKDILLISEKTLIIDLPSDLKNWECLTYQKGNYEELKSSVENYIKQTYF